MQFTIQRVNTPKLAILMILDNSSIFTLRSNLKGSLSEVFSMRLFITNSLYLNFVLHLRLATSFYQPQSLELFAYQSSATGCNLLNSQFYLTQAGLGLSLNTQTELSVDSSLKKTWQRQSLASVDKIFQNYWWMEREASEMHDVWFENKADGRNLLMEYMAVLKPMLRSFPSYGLYELFYDTLRGVMIHRKVSLQF